MKNNKSEKEKIFKKLISFHKAYKQNLENKDFLLLFYNENELKKISISFDKKNFFHLTGLNKTNLLTPNKFYKKLENKTLSLKDIEIKNFTTKKLSASSDMIKIFNKKSKIALYNPQNKYQKKLSIDSGLTLSNSNSILGIRFIDEKKAVPVSLLKQKLENICLKETTTDIVCILKKEKTEEKYNEINENTLSLNEIIKTNPDIKNLISNELLNQIDEKENKKENKWKKTKEINNKWSKKLAKDKEGDLEIDL